MKLNALIPYPLQWSMLRVRNECNGGGDETECPHSLTFVTVHAES